MRTVAISGMMGTIHGEMRFFFLAVVVIGLARTLYGLARRSEFSDLDGRLALVYSILLDLQALYGIGLILYLAFVQENWSLRIALNWIGWHPVWMLAAVVVGHLGARWKAAPGRMRFQVQLGVYAVTLALIFIGVMTSPLKGWR